MLSGPEHGWAKVELGGRRLDVSYIQPVPEMLLTTFIRALSTDGRAQATFDAEGWHWQMELGDPVRVTILGNPPESWAVPASTQELARELIADVRRDMKEWSGWQPRMGDSEGAWLSDLCRKLEALLD